MAHLRGFLGEHMWRKEKEKMLSKNI